MPSPGQPRRLPLPAPMAEGRAWAMPVRLRYAPGDAYDLHRHAFPELFWVEEGTVRHHIGGAVQQVAAGELVAIRPHDIHALAAGQRGFTLVNLPLHPGLVEGIASRHRTGLARWPWDAGPEPFRVTLSGPQSARLGEWADILGHDPSRLATESFVLDLLRMLAAPERPPATPDLPPWLATAVRRFIEDARLEGGSSAFIALTGRSADHVNRTVRAHFQQTTTALVNQLRLRRAARMLRLADTAIVDIAMACGFASLAHFYRAFARAYRTTPRRYRRDHQGLARAGIW